MRGRIWSIFIALLLVFVGFIGFLHFSSENVGAPPTFVSGIISTDTTWDLAGSPYIITSTLIVDNGVTLTIDPGVEVKVDGYYYISIDGTLNAVGTSVNRIIITSNMGIPAPSDWAAIRINSNGHVEMSYTDVSYSHFGIRLSPSSNNNITNCKISWNNFYGLYLSSSSNNYITGNYISNNECGICLYFTSTNNIITGNSVSNNDNGILLYHTSTNNNITGNIVANNVGRGIYLSYTSNNNIITGNVVSNSYKGIGLDSWVSNNRVYNNNIINNTYQAYDKMDSNFWNYSYYWDAPNPSGGNYWSNYDEVAEGCVDNFDGPTTPQTGSSGPDGICDLQYNIDADSTDYYPLASPSIIDKPPLIETWEPGGTLGQLYTQGDSISITWNASDDYPLPSNPINITYGVTGSWTTIAINEQNDGIYNWNTSSVQCPGTYWMNLSVYDTIGQKTFDESNYSYNITCPDFPPMIEVWEPGGTVDQIYTKGDIITIRWNASDNNPLPLNPINITFGNLSAGWISIAANEPNDQEYNWNTLNVPCPGTYWMNLSVYDSIGQTSFDKSNYSFNITCPDVPITTIHIGMPQYGVTPTYINSTSSLWFTAIDFSGTGYNIYYYVDTVPEITYTGSFTIPDEGGHVIYYYSIDNLGGVEALKEFDVIVDNTPPITIIDVGHPKHIDGEIWLTSNSEITLSATDGGLIPVATNYTEYRVWNNGLWTLWAKYSSAFTLDVEDGITYIEFYSVDYLGNKENIHNETYFDDNTSPVTTPILQLESDNTEARISLIANDADSGVNYTKYRIDNGDWKTYSGTFIVNESGSHTIYFWSVDRLGNIEIEKNFSVLIKEPVIVVPPGDGEEEVNWKSLIALIFTIILLLVGTYVSHKRPLKFIKNPKRRQVYTWMIAVFPFVVAEIATGIVSYLTGLLVVPPLLGPGMVVDLAILILGLFICILIYKKLGEK